MNSLDSRIVKIEVNWVRRDRFMEYMYITLCFITLGILPILTLFDPTWRIKLKCSSCSPRIADYIIIKKYFFDSEIETFSTVEHTDISETGEHIVSAEVNCERYCASSFDDFLTYRAPDAPILLNKYILKDKDKKSIDWAVDRKIMKAIYGKNVMSIPALDVTETVIKHALNPFLMIGYFSATIWYIEDYNFYSTFVLIVCLLGIYTLTEETILNHERLTELVGKTNLVKKLNYTSDGYQQIDERDLLPGDSFLVEDFSRDIKSQEAGNQKYQILPCDALLLEGRVVVDESMLTGESIPSTKISLDSTAAPCSPSFLAKSTAAINWTFPSPLSWPETEILPREYLESPSSEATSTSSSSNSSSSRNSVVFSQTVASKQPGSVLYAGTRVLYASDASVALCFRSGFRSTKGLLIASMVHPRPGFLQFFQDAIWVITMMFILASVLYFFEMIRLLQENQSWSIIILHYFDALTIAIPVALVACIVVSTTISILRLRREHIFVNESSRVNFSGIVSVTCFDKTGTLTEDALQFQGFHRPKVDNSSRSSSHKGNIDVDATWESVESSAVEVMSVSPHRGIPKNLPIAPASASISSAAQSTLNPLGLSQHSSLGGNVSSSSSERQASFVSSSFPWQAWESMATCHNLSISYGNIVGDSLEQELFRVSQWQVIHHDAFARDMSTFLIPTSWNSGNNGSSKSPSLKLPFATTTIVRHYPFTPEKMRSASLVARNNGSLALHLKGSPEAILSLCTSSSIPSNVQDKILQLTRKGCRVIALAYRDLGMYSDSSSLKSTSSSSELDNKLQAMSSQDHPSSLPFLSWTQEELESRPLSLSTTTTVSGDGRDEGLQFLGLISLTNRLKEETPATIHQLLRARIHVTMITGDHIFTAINTARECGLLKTSRELVSPLSTTTTNPPPTTSSTTSTSFIPSSSRLVGSHIVTVLLVEDPLAPTCLILLDADTNQVLPFHIFELIDILSHLHRGLTPKDFLSNSTQWTSWPLAWQQLEAMEIAMTGAALGILKRKYSSFVFNMIVRSAKVFARTKPLEKMMIVKELMEKPAWNFIFSDSDWEMKAPTLSPSTSNPSSTTTATPATTTTTTTTTTPLAAPPSTTLASSSAYGRKSITLVPDEDSQGLCAWVGLNNCSSSPACHCDSHHPYVGSECYPPVDTVLFCGDGANDIMALRQASVGISLCEVETSIAAPITAMLASPKAVVDLMIEGRSSLITTYVLVHFNILFGWIVLIMTSILYYYDLIVCDSMYWIQGALFSLVPGTCIAITPPASSLGSELPPSRYFSYSMMGHLLPQMLLAALFQLFAIYYLSLQDFYVKYETDEPLSETYSYEATVLQDLVLAQLMIVSVVSTIGHPFRVEWYTSHVHVYSLVLLSGWILFQVFAGDLSFAENVLVLMPLPVEFGFQLVGIMIANAVASVALWKLMAYYFPPASPYRGFPKVVVTSDENHTKVIFKTNFRPSSSLETRDAAASAEDEEEEDYFTKNSYGHSEVHERKTLL